MTASISVTPASPTAVVSACRIDVTGADLNDTTTFDGTDTGRSPGNTVQYPSEDEVRYYLLMENPSGDDGRSYAFAPGSDGSHSLNNYIFPNSGSWTVSLRKVSDDSEVTTQAVTVG